VVTVANQGNLETAAEFALLEAAGIGVIGEGTFPPLRQAVFHVIVMMERTGRLGRGGRHHQTECGDRSIGDFAKHDKSPVTLLLPCVGYSQEKRWVRRCLRRKP
jgi:hypothetical protein